MMKQKFDEQVLEQVKVVDEHGEVDLEASCTRCPYREWCEASISYCYCSVWEEAMGDDL